MSNNIRTILKKPGDYINVNNNYLVIYKALNGSIKKADKTPEVESIIHRIKEEQGRRAQL